MKKVLFSVATSLLLMSQAANAQLAKGNPCKFLGNITTRGAIPSNYATMWDQLTPENETKWGSIANKEVQSVDEALRSWNWTSAVNHYNWCKKNGVQFKFHCLLWTSQYPSYLKNFTGARLKKQIDIWFEACSKKFPDVTIIDVVNEALPGHAEGDNNGQAKTFKNNLAAAMVSGSKPSDYRWITEAFKMARKFFPNAVLVYNDYNTFKWSKNDFITLVSTLVKQGAPIDAYGHQSHDLNTMSGSDFKTALYDIHNQITQKSGRELACYLTEYDIAKQGDNGQKTRYSEQIPIAWEAKFVAGITLWGYVHGATWVDDSGLIKNGQDRPAMTWLRQYMASDKAKAARANTCGKDAAKGVKNVSLTINAASKVIALGDSVKITAEMNEAKNIRFNANGVQIKDKWVFPCEFYWTPSEAGDYKIEATGVNNNGDEAKADMTIKVVEVSPYGGSPAVIPGKIEAENYNKGYAGITYNDLSEGNTCDEYTNYYRSDDVDIKKINNGVALGHCQKGEWMNYTVNVESDGEYEVTLRVGTGNSDGGKMTVTIGNVSKEVTIEKTGDWGTFADVKVGAMRLSKGEQTMKLSIDKDWIDVDWISFQKDLSDVENFTNNNVITVVPNPASSMIEILGAGDDVKVEFVSLAGSVIKVSNETAISLDDVDNGIYMLRITTPNERTVKKLVVKK